MPRLDRPRTLVASVLLLLFVLPGAACKRRAKPASEEKLPEVALFSRHYLEAIYQEDIPAQDEVGRPVRIAAARGEYEPASVGVRTKIPLYATRLTVSALSGPGGAEIPADRITVRVTRYIQPFEKWKKIEEHPRPPGFLDPVPAVDILAKSSQQFWILVHVPEDARAGTYRGTVTLRTVGADPQTLPMELEVYPFTLEEVSADLFVYGDNWPLEDRTLAISRAYGMNTICVSPGWIKQVVPVYKDGAFTFPDGFPQVQQVIEAARRHGLGVKHRIGVMTYQHFVRSTGFAIGKSGPPAPPEVEGTLDFRTSYPIFFDKGTPIEKVDRFKAPYYPTPDPLAIPTTPYGRALFDGWVTVLKELDAFSRAKGYPPFFYYLADEPHQTRGSMRLAMTMLRAAKEAGADSYITCNEPTLTEPDPEKVWFKPVGNEPELRLSFLTTRAYHNRYLGPETRERAKAAGARYGTYINIYGNQPASVRYQAGYLAWRLGLESVMFWALGEAASKVGEPGNEQPSFLRDWEATREGIDDLRYLETLSRAIAAGRGTPEARAAAESLLQRVRDEIVPNVRAIGFVDGQSGEWVPGDKAWSAAQYDDVRAQVARALASLR